MAAEIPTLNLWYEYQGDTPVGGWAVQRGWSNRRRGDATTRRDARRSK